MRQIIISSKWLILLASLLVFTLSRCSSTVTHPKHKSDEEESLKEWMWAEDLAKMAESSLVNNASPDRGPKCWPEYYKAVMFLYQGGNRNQMAELFDKVIETAEWKEGPPYWSWMYLHEYTATAKELSPLLKLMSEEDKKWKEPDDISKLSLDKQIDYYIYKIRDMAYTPDPPVPPEPEIKLGAHLRNQGCCPAISFIPDVPVSELKKLPDNQKNPAIKLVEIGKPAVPALINLLSNRRPTRSIGWERMDYATRVVVRYQDVALEIIERILDKKFGEDWYWYFSLVNEEDHQKTIDEIKAYWKKTEGDKPEK